MQYLLDTNVWIDYLKGVDVSIRSRILAAQPNSIFVCSVVVAELLHGAKKYGAADRRAGTVHRTLECYNSLPFDNGSAEVYAELRHQTDAIGKKLGSNDLMIAAIALQHGLTLVTHDQAFSRIAGLPIEDWRTA